MKRDAIDFGKDPVGQLFRKMLLPTLLGMVSLVILNVTDGAFVGHGAGSNALAAVNIIAPVFTIISGIGLMLGIGGSVVASIHLSNGNVKAANINVTQSLLGGFMLCALIGAIMLSFQEQTARLFGASDALVPEACTYLKWISMGLPLSTLSVMGNFFIRLDGSPNTASAITVVGALLNILLDYILIFPLHMGLEGAAIATTLCYSACGLASFIYIACFGRTVKLYRLKCSLTSLKLTCRNLWNQTKIGFSALLGELAMASMMIMGNYQFIKMLGEDGVAAFSVACYLTPVVFMVANGIIESNQPIISFAYAGGMKKRMDDMMKISLGTGIISGLAVIAVMALAAGPIVTVFLEQGCRAWELCKEGLPLYCISTLFIIINVVIVGYNQSVEKGTRATIYTLLRGFVFMIPAFLLLPRWFGNNGLWLALVAAELCSTLVIAVSEYFTCFRRKN